MRLKIPILRTSETSQQQEVQSARQLVQTSPRSSIAFRPCSPFRRERSCSRQFESSVEKQRTLSVTPYTPRLLETQVSHYPTSSPSSTTRHDDMISMLNAERLQQSRTIARQQEILGQQARELEAVRRSKDGYRSTILPRWSDGGWSPRRGGGWGRAGPTDAWREKLMGVCERLENRGTFLTGSEVAGFMRLALGGGNETSAKRQRSAPVGGEGSAGNFYSPKKTVRGKKGGRESYIPGPTPNRTLFQLPSSPASPKSAAVPFLWGGLERDEAYTDGESPEGGVDLDLVYWDRGTKKNSETFSPPVFPLSAVAMSPRAALNSGDKLLPLSPLADLEGSYQTPIGDIDLTLGGDGRLRGQWGTQPVEVGAAGRGEVTANFTFSGMKISGIIRKDSIIQWMGGQFWKKKSQVPMKTSTEDFSGKWFTGFNEIILSPYSLNSWHGVWGVREVELKREQDGVVAILGAVSMNGQFQDQKIKWGNGQLWTKQLD